MDPATMAMIGMSAGNALQAGFGGGEEYNPGKLHQRWTDPYQGALFQMLMKQGMSGGGDFGFGQAAKAGTGQVQQLLADRGISPESGIGLGLQGNVISDAMGTDIANRRNWMMNLLAATPKKDTSAEGWDDAYEYGRWNEWQSTNAPSARGGANPYWGSAEDYFG